MDAHPAVHPTDEKLNSFGLGKLDDRSAAAIMEHLEQCPDCQKRLAEMSADSFVERIRGVWHGHGSLAPVGSELAGSSMTDTSARSLTPPLPPALPPALANHPDYEIIRELGHGGMGVVYLAHNRLMDRHEVLKVIGHHIVERPGVLDRFLREIRAVARLRHPNIVSAYAAFRCGDSLVFAMEYAEGLDLARMVKARGPLQVAQACYYVQQAALGLQHAHEEGMVHRDIKPANLTLTHKKGRAVIKVLDFGLSKATSEQNASDLGIGEPSFGGNFGETLTRVGQMLGTPDFIAPEQIVDAQKADIRADIYSLGCALYCLLSGRAPFEATTLYDLLQAHQSMDATRLNFLRPEVPAELAALVAKMMAKEPARRFQEPDEVAHALTPFFKKGSVSVGPASVDSSQVRRPVVKRGDAKVVPVPEWPATRIAAGNVPAAAKPSDAARSRSVLDGLINLSETDPLFDVMLDAPRPDASPELTQRRYPAWSTAVKKLPGFGSRGWRATAGILLLSLLLASSAVIFKIKTRHGVIVLENVPENALVEVDGDRITVHTAQGDPIKIEGQAGKHVVVVKRGDDVLMGESVTLQSGQELKLTVHLDRPAAPGAGEADVDHGPARSEDSKPRMLARAEVGATSSESRPPPMSKTDRAVAWHRLMSRQGTKSEGPAPLACWSFESGAHDEIGTMHGKLLGGAYVREGRLYLDGRAAYMRAEPLPQDVREKTMEAWVSLPNLVQRGGGVMSIEDAAAFDGIVFGLSEPAKWIADSEWRMRTKNLAGPIENAQPWAVIHLAVVYDLEGGITVYRQGTRYCERYIPRRGRLSLQTFAAGESHILFGERHTRAPDFLAGAIEEARLYDRGLTADEVAAAYRAGVIRYTTVVAAAKDPGTGPATVRSDQGKPPSAPTEDAAGTGAGALAGERSDTSGQGAGSGKADAPHPFRVATNGLGGTQFIDPITFGRPDAPGFPEPGPVRPWVAEDAFARLATEAMLAYPPLPVSRYVFEVELTVKERCGVSLLLGDLWDKCHLDFYRNAERKMIECTLKHWTGGFGAWGGSRDFAPGSRVRLTVVAGDGMQVLFQEKERVLDALSWPTDCSLRIWSVNPDSAVIDRCSLRPLTARDAAACGWPIPPSSLAFDAGVAPGRLRQISRRYPEQPQAGKRFAVKTTGTPMAWIPPGDFRMGSRDPKDEGRHRVRLTKGYWIAQIEVAQAEYSLIAGANPSRVTGSPYLPVDWVTWDQATAYCRKLTDLERKAGRLPAGYEYRLPTEAEWEYACRAGSNEDFSVPQEQVWSRDCGGRRPHEVAESKPNNWGLYDMHGNALEWCFDAWYDYPKGNKEATVDPFTIGRPGKDEWFVVRGGAWWSPADGCSSHWRNSNHNNPNGFCGFRVVLGPEIREPFAEVARFFDGETFVDCAVVSPDGRRVLSGSLDGLMILWDLGSRQLIRRFRGHEGLVRTVAFAPDGRRALSGGDDKMIRLWDLESGETIREFHGHSESILSVAFSPDGRLAYSSSGGFWANGDWQDGDDSAVRVWDVETGSEIRKLAGHKGLVWHVTVSPDGRRLLSGGSDRALILWDAKTGAEIRRLPGHTDKVERVAFLPDGRRGLSCSWDGTIRIWDLDTGEEVHRIRHSENRGRQGRLSHLTVSLDGRRLLCASIEAHEVTLWDLEARKLIHRFDWGNVGPTRGSFTPDGRHAVWPGSDGVIRMYRLASPNPDTVDRSALPRATKP